MQFLANEENGLQVEEINVHKDIKHAYVQRNLKGSRKKVQPLVARHLGA